MKRTLRWMAILGLGGVLAVSAVAAYYWWYEPSDYPVRGVDVSHHQGTIDWYPLAQDDVSFAYIKATEGGDWTDPEFARNWRQAKAVGLARGAYHFYTLCRPVQDQISHIIATVPAEKGALPLAIDLEFGGNCAGRPAVADLRADLIYLIKTLENHYGQRPVLYLTAEFEAAYLDGAFETEAVWLRSIAWKPSASGRAWLFWQYHNKGRRAGVAGPIDLNAFNGDAESWQKYLKDISQP